MTQSNDILSINDLYVSYGGVPALEGVSLSVKQGQITTIIGANGAGKTTLMKAVAGLLTPAKGKITFQGDDITGLSPAETVAKGLTLVPEGRRLFPTMSIRDNLMSGAYVRTDKAAIEKDLETVLSYFPVLTNRLNMPANSLSGGQQQMLAVGRALMASPRLLMLDEPSIGLAPTIVETIGNIIQTISRNGVDILLVEQNAHMALELADQAYVLENGQITLTGKGQELIENDKVREAYLGL
ncbi:MAG: ABC transporter ATP-binding protein [Sneathiella sp.]|jgi:branched-chain amino acid transport system ATP-binding protein|uniref:ABC transporter ATP-binding protein n=1 Tax=Sneathiella sp. TaxID=1964365 RepID=UPI000C356146|nr:ABC transporter ATP-binding protein [Sneathiella sp.]MAL80407.1 ABC transporter ATP-binding protein [Sneathiella sp.]|tara:strand:- start:3843 stop:4565 length:723 start_codon:yes stop_codon:yes gene_type:complete